jgi:hypothetical protein
MESKLRAMEMIELEKRLQAMEAERAGLEPGQKAGKHERQTTTSAL